MTDSTQTVPMDTNNQPNLKIGRIHYTVARKAEAAGVKFVPCQEGFMAECSHTGFKADGLKAGEVLDSIIAERPEFEVKRKVVPQAYKDDYAARGNRDNCGDWFAGFATTLFHEGVKFDHKKVVAFFKLNGIPFQGKWSQLPSSGSAGWVGRFRMNAGQIARKHLAEHGRFYTLDANGKKVANVPPAEYLSLLQVKHKKVVPAYTLKDGQVKFPS